MKKRVSISPPVIVARNIPVAIVVKAKDGRWSYGRYPHDEKELEARATGDFASAADASQAAAQDHDIIINTAPPPLRKRKVQPRIPINAQPHVPSRTPIQPRVRIQPRKVAT